MESCQGGLFIPPEDPLALRDGILTCQKEPHLIEKWGQNGRLFTQANYSRQALAGELAMLLTSLA
jgi:hypothetical protein